MALNTHTHTTYINCMYRVYQLDGQTGLQQYLHLQLAQLPLEVSRVLTRTHLLVEVQLSIQQLLMGLQEEEEQ